MLLMFCCLSQLSFGQTTTNDPTTISRCHTDEYHELLMQDADFADKFSTMQMNALAEIQGNQKITCTNGVVTIPIAVHFNGNVNSSNLACLQAAAEAQVQVLNEDFGAYNSDITNFCDIATACPGEIAPDALSTGSCIQFCLATQNHPACSGLSNGQAAITVGQYTFNGGAACWSGYLNIFVVDGLNFLGQAPLFGGNNPNGNGVQVVADAFGGPGVACTSGTGINTSGTFDLGRTTTHEIGHYLGLNHVFDGCGNGDGIADTPSQSSSNFGCPTFNTTNCTSTASNTCSTTDFFFNYMDYVNDECMYMFTDDQAQLMYNTATSHNNWATNTCAAADLPNYAPIYSGPCATDPPVAGFETASSLTVCENNPTISFQDLSESFPSAYDWSFFGAGVSPSSSTAQNPIITVSQSGTLTVTLDVSNGSGSDSFTQDFNVSVLPVGHPNCPTCTNGITDGSFESGFWNESSSNGFAIITDDLPLTGNNSAWLGGAVSEASFITQTITIPANTTSAIMTYNYLIDSNEGCGGPSNDVGGIAVDDNNDSQFNILTTIDMCNTSDTNGAWQTSTYDFSSYIGQTIDIAFYASTNQNNQITNFYIDDVDFEICSTVALSIELLNLEAVAVDRQIDVNWTTTNEINNSHFEVLRSISPTEGFELIEKVAPKVNGGAYKFIDYNVRPGITYYYQLQQFDFDNTKADLGIVSASIRSGLEVNVTPNPATSFLNVHIANEGKADFKVDVVDIVGKVVSSQIVELDGADIINLDINDLQAGVYLLNVASNGVLVSNTRFIKN